MARIVGIVWLAVQGLAASAQVLPSKIDEVARSIARLEPAPAALTAGILAEDDAAAAVRTPFVLPGQHLDERSEAYLHAVKVFASAPADQVQASLGPDWVLAYGWLTSRERVRFELSNSKLRVLSACMRDEECSLDFQVGGTLAAALRDAYKVYYPFSRPLPAALVAVLREVVPENTLNVARWAVGPVPELAVPGFLGSGHFAGRNRAVTLGSLMIFSRMPELTDPADLEWLLHELRHVEQHRALSQVILESVDAFALQYLWQSEALEQDAAASAQRRLALR